MTFQRVLLDAPTLLRAAWTKSPLRTRCWREGDADRWQECSDCKAFTGPIYCLWLLVTFKVSLSVPDVYWKRSLGTLEGLTEVAKASIESRVTQTGAVGPVAAAIIGAVAPFIAQFPIEPLRTACTPDTNRQDDNV